MLLYIASFLSGDFDTQPLLVYSLQSVLRWQGLAIYFLSATARNLLTELSCVCADEVGGVGSSSSDQQ